MKRFSIAAAALLLGTSAFAWTPSAKPVDRPMADKDPVAVTHHAAVDDAFAGQGAQWRPAAADEWSDADERAEDETALKSAHAAKSLGAMADGDPDLDLSVDPDEADLLAAHEEADAEALAAAEAEMTGVGGPYEAADLTPRPAAENYPPCRPGPGDDRCIQLYEPGVRDQLAAWTQPTGGLLDETRLAMGGPEADEPFDEESFDLAMWEGDQDEYDLAAI